MRRGLGIGHTQGADRGGDDHRRGPIGSNAQAARWVNFPDTQMRHFLPGAVLGLARGVVALPGRARLVALRRSLAGSPLAGLAAPIAAILLPAIAAPADVEHGAAEAAAALAEAVVRAAPGA